MFPSTLQYPSKQILGQSRQYKYWKKVWTMFKINNKDTKTTSWRRSGVCCWPFSSVYFVDFEQVNVGCVFVSFESYNYGRVNIYNELKQWLFSRFYQSSEIQNIISLFVKKNNKSIF